MAITVPIWILSRRRIKTSSPSLSPAHQYNPWYAYLAPGLGLIKEVQYRCRPSAEHHTAPRSSIQTGIDGGLPVPHENGMRLIYNASDKLGNKWQMTMRMQEQVTFGGHTYFRVRQNNYYGPGAKPGVLPEVQRQPGLDFL